MLCPHLVFMIFLNLFKDSDFSFIQDFTNPAGEYLMPCTN